MKKLNKDIALASYNEVFDWIKSQKPHETTPVYISKAKESSSKFRVWCFSDALLLAGNEKDKNVAQFIMTREQWSTFENFVKKNPYMCRGELGEHYTEFGFTYKNRSFWPSIIHLCNAFFRVKNKKSYGTI